MQPAEKGSVRWGGDGLKQEMTSVLYATELTTMIKNGKRKKEGIKVPWKMREKLLKVNHRLDLIININGCKVGQPNRLI